MAAGNRALGASSSLYYVFVLLIGRYLIMNLLIAVVLHSFATDVEGMRDGQLTPREGTPRGPRDVRLDGTVRM